MNPFTNSASQTQVLRPHIKNSLTKIKPIILGTLILTNVLSVMFSQPVFADGEHYGAVHQTWLKPSPSNPGAEFGNELAMDGNTLVVGARHDSVTVGVDTIYQSGAAYVYVRDGNSWTLQARLAASDTDAYDLFGSSVAINNNTIIIGAVGSDGTDENDNAAPDMGAAYVFTRSGDQWEQQAKIEPEDGIEDDNFGNAVAIVSERVVVAASAKDFGDIEDAGKVYSYYRSGTKWYQAQSVAAPKTSKDSFFGSSLDYDGQRLVIGAQSENNNTGAAFVYYRVGSTWTQEAAISPESDHTGDNFGASVSIDGETIVIGAPFADPDLGSGEVTNAGAAYVFHKRPSGWYQQAKLLSEDAMSFDHFGRSVEIDDTTIVVGANSRDYYTILRSGAAHIYQRSAREWQFQSEIISGEPYNDADFGSSLALDDSLIIVGEPGTSTQFEAGTVHVYSLEVGILPNTGFNPNVQLETSLEQPQAGHSDQFEIEISKLNLQTSIIGVPRQDNTWDVNWLTTSVGLLDGTAYPAQVGNSVIAGHLNLPDGSQGPFADIDQLQWGDEIIVYMDGHELTYEVRQIYTTDPHDLGILEKSDGYEWLTLISCANFNEKNETYTKRIIVEAVRVK